MVGQRIRETDWRVPISKTKTGILLTFSSSRNWFHLQRRKEEILEIITTASEDPKAVEEEIKKEKTGKNK